MLTLQMPCLKLPNLKIVRNLRVLLTSVHVLRVWRDVENNRVSDGNALQCLCLNINDTDIINSLDDQLVPTGSKFGPVGSLYLRIPL